MNGWGLSGVALVYLFVAIDYAMKKDPGMCLSFICYAGANVGFIWSSMK